MILLCINMNSRKKITHISNFERSEIYFRERDFNNSLKYLDIAFKDLGGDDLVYCLTIHRLRGTIYQLQGNYHNAIDEYSGCIQHNDSPVSFIYLWNRGTCYYYIDEYSEAIDDYIDAFDNLRLLEGGFNRKVEKYREINHCFITGISGYFDTHLPVPFESLDDLLAFLKAHADMARDQTKYEHTIKLLEDMKKWEESGQM